MAILHFYRGKELTHQSDQTDNIINLSLTGGLNGSVGGYVTIEVTPNNKPLIDSLKENSHFIRVGHTKVFGAVVESVTQESNVATVNFVGGFEYMAKMDAIASHKANVTSGSAYSGNKSWEKVFYSDSTVGILYEALRNNNETMDKRNYNSNLFNISPLRSHITSNTSNEWARSYRLNSFETPSMQDVLASILEDDGMELFRIRVSSNPSDNFAFIFEIVSSSDVVTINEATDNIFGIDNSVDESLRRSFSIAKGTDLEDRSVLERVSFDNSVAYSSLISEAPQERSSAIRRYASSSATNAQANYGQVTFNSYLDNINVLDYVTIDSPSMDAVSGIIVEKNIEGEIINYSMQTGPAASFNGELQKSSGMYRKILFNPLHDTSVLGRKTAGKKDNTTGWRS